MIHIVVKSDQENRQNPYDPIIIELQVDFQEFLGNLSNYPWLARLSGLPMYGRTLIERSWLTGLKCDCDKLCAEIRSGKSDLEIPGIVGISFDEDTPTKMGSEGLHEWASRLRHLCQLALDADAPMFAVGN